MTDNIHSDRYLVILFQEWKHHLKWPNTESVFLLSNWKLFGQCCFWKITKNTREREVPTEVHLHSPSNTAVLSSSFPGIIFQKEG